MASAPSQGGGGAGTTAPAEPRRLLLHFNLPKTLLIADPDGKGSADGAVVTTESVLRKAVADLAWGSLNPEDASWNLAHPDLSQTCPDDAAGLVTYREYLNQVHPLEGQKFTIEENTKLQREKLNGGRRRGEFCVCGLVLVVVLKNGFGDDFVV